MAGLLDPKSSRSFSCCTIIVFLVYLEAIVYMGLVIGLALSFFSKSDYFWVGNTEFLLTVGASEIKRVRVYLPWHGSDARFSKTNQMTILQQHSR